MERKQYATIISGGLMLYTGEYNSARTVYTSGVMLIGVCFKDGTTMTTAQDNIILSNKPWPFMDTTDDGSR